MTVPRILLLALVLTTIVPLSIEPVRAAVPQLISQQGRLTDASGNPVPDGPQLLRFQIYDAPVGGTALWDSQYRQVVITDGAYTYVLGQDVPFPAGLFDSATRWLGITVGVDPEMTPRRQFLTSPYSAHAENSDIVPWTGITGVPAGFADGVDDNSGDITAVTTSDGLTGGATSGEANIAIAVGGVTSALIGDGQIADVDIDPAAAIAPAKIAGTAATLAATQTFTGINTFAAKTAFRDSVDDNYPHKAIEVELTNIGGAAAEGITVRTLAFDGLATALDTWSHSDYFDRAGAIIRANSFTPYSTVGTTRGVQAYGTDGAWVYGVSARSMQSIEGRGVSGEARIASYQGIGVHGLAMNCPNLGIGVSGQATQNAYAIGVYAEAWDNSVDSKAGYFAGDVTVTGTIFMPSFVARIDHPFDPENKYLQHADVHSPDMINVYTGNVVTDDAGAAVVTLPDYFSAINGDFRYQLTVVGQFAQAIIGEKITGNHFTIKTDKPNVEVSWLVAGIRQDQFAKANPVSVEVAKLPRDVGTYLHPQAYGLSPERSETAAMRASTMRQLESADGNEANHRQPPIQPNR